jgi:hypothetical protein
MAPSVSAGFKVTHTPHSKLAVSLKKRTTVNPKLTFSGWWPEKTVFSGQRAKTFPKTSCFRERPICL